MTRATRSHTGHLPKPARREFLVNPGVGDDPFGLRQKRFRGAKRKIGKPKQVVYDPDSDEESEQEIQMGPPRGIPALLPPSTMAPTEIRVSPDLPAEDDASALKPPCLEPPNMDRRKISRKPVPYRKPSLGGYCMKEALGFVVDESNPKYADDARIYRTFRAIVREVVCSKLDPEISWHRHTVVGRAEAVSGVRKRAEEIGIDLKGKDAVLEDVCKNVIDNRRDDNRRLVRKGLPSRPIRKVQKAKPANQNGQDSL